MGREGSTRSRRLRLEVGTFSASYGVRILVHYILFMKGRLAGEHVA